MAAHDVQGCFGGPCGREGRATRDDVLERMDVSLGGEGNVDHVTTFRSRMFRADSKTDRCSELSAASSRQVRRIGKRGRGGMDAPAPIDPGAANFRGGAQ